MAYATAIRTQGAGITDRLIAWWKSALEAQATRQEYRVTVRELNALSTRELSDLGIARGEIRHIAWHAAYGK